MRWLLLLVLFCASAARADWEKPTVPEYVALGVTETLIAVDMLQTVDLSHRYSENYWEWNPLLGKHPSTEHVVAFGLASMVLTAATWAVLPRGARGWFASVVGAVEVGFVVANHDIGLRVRF